MVVEETFHIKAKIFEGRGETYVEIEKFNKLQIHFPLFESVNKKKINVPFNNI